MSKLIQLKQRIKTVLIIKKITNSMRLIAISSHCKLKKKIVELSVVVKEIKSELEFLCDFLSKKEAVLVSKNLKSLYIVFASEKGLCGNFNSSILFFLKNKVQIDSEKNDFIGVGSKVNSIFKKCKINSLINFDSIKINNIEEKAELVFNFLLPNLNNYSNVFVVFNYSKTFFNKVPVILQLYPFTNGLMNEKKNTRENDAMLDRYVFHEDKENILQSIKDKLLYYMLLEVFINSIMTEQASRFLSMDNSTRNAETLLKTMKIQYNKIRQTKITKELIGLYSNI